MPTLEVHSAPKLGTMQRMEVSYLKMHGTGNLILVVDQRSGTLSPPGAEKLRELGDDATGPGFDQLMWISGSDDAKALASYRVFNADGSEVEQCGNGVRCVARYLAGESGGTFVLQSPAGPIEARVDAGGSVAVSMGAPSFGKTSYELVDVDGEPYEVSTVSMGNPHCVLRVADVDTAPVNTVGPKLEIHPRFPQGTNVGFMQIAGRDRIALRVHERGVGETRACGTGACAAVVTGQRLGLLDTDVRVALPGGEVVVSWRGGGDPVWLAGNAELISEGTIEL